MLTATSLRTLDPEIYAAIAAELARQQSHIELIASENFTYPAVMEALLEIGYSGYVGQEFIPTKDKVASLAEGVRICDV